MGRCDFTGCEGDKTLSYTCNECGERYCSIHRLPENHNCRVLRKGSTDGKPFESGLQGKNGKKRGLTDRSSQPGTSESPSPMDLSDHTIGVSDTDDPTPYAERGSSGDSSESGSVANRSQIISSDDYPSRHLILTKVAGILRKALYLALIVGIIAGAGLWLGGGSIPTADDVSGTFAAAMNETDDLAGSTSPKEATTEEQAASGEFSQSTVERSVHQEINSVRKERGLTPLTFDEGLREVARYHSEDMASSEYFAHTSPSGETMEDRYQKFGYQCRVSTGGNRYVTGGENIAKTYYHVNVVLDNGSTVYYDSPEELAKGVVDQWMNSEGHRENILRPYWENEGIGVHISEEGGGTAVYVTQNFC